jgi:type IV pilus assembly protein PilQ
MRKVLLYTLWCLVLSSSAQDRFASIANRLESAVVDHPGLDGTVELSVSGTPVTEFVRALGASHALNLTVDPSVKGEVVNNFSDARVLDVLIYLCRNYDLDVELIGNSIISLIPYRPPPPPLPEPAPIRQMVVDYHADSGLIDLDLRQDTLEDVAREISLASGTNVVLAPELGKRSVSVFLRNCPLPVALDKLAFANGLMVEHAKDGTYELYSAIVTASTSSTGKPKEARSRNSPAGEGMDLEKTEGEWLSIDADDIPAERIIKEASSALNKQYFIYDNIDLPSTLHLTHATYEELLTALLRGSPYSYSLHDSVYLIGKRDLEGLRQTEMIRLRNRPVKDVSQAIPEALKKDVSISEFGELNALILSGDELRIREIGEFLRQIDQTVPLVMIEVMIVDVNRNRTVSAGVNAGVGGGPAESGGTLLPGVNYNMNSTTLNSMINSFNGFGVFNLGNVTPGFYLSIQALETEGMLKLRSTPQLSTLNGHEATMSIGQTEYYLEERNDLIGTQNPTLTTSQTYKPIKADLSLKITPQVSSEDMVTLDIEVVQSNFTTRISETAPPGTVERKFNSIVRAKDKDMIVLGGLEERENSKSGSGLPLLSRIPVLKWFFGSHTATTRKTKLTLFIRPTILY